ncbi:MAG TPA: hypothetical protein VD738_10320 [Nitrospira sp.]|nr:hypothetical protein [Nitrospira sp.]
MDWSLWLGLAVFLIAAGIGAFSLYRFVVRTKENFREHQPALRVTNLSTMNAGNMLTLTPELENVGRGVAYDCVLQLGGWEGKFSVMAVHPQGSRHRKHAVSIVLGPDAPIRTKPLSNGYLRLGYRDCWGLTYECWYPVVQVKSSTPPLYNVHIDLAHPELTEPNPSFLDMRRLLRSTPLHD